jgi:predicted dehydrogenase
MKPTPTYKLGLIGLGEWGRKIWATLSEMPNVKVVSVCRKTDQRPDFLPPDCKFFTHYLEMFQHHQIHGKLDGVIIATSPFVNAELIKTANDYGVPVMVEKPVVITRAELIHCLEYDQIKIPVLVDYVHLYAPAFRKMQALSKSWHPSRLTFQNEGRSIDRNFASLFDYGSHDVAMALVLLSGEVKVEECKYQPTFGNQGDVWQLSFSIGSVPVIGHIVNGSYRKHRSFEVENDEQYLAYDAFTDPKLVFAEYRNKCRPIEVDPTPPLTAAISAFLAMIDGAPDPQKSWQLTPKIVETLEQIHNRLI